MKLPLRAALAAVLLCGATAAAEVRFAQDVPIAVHGRERAGLTAIAVTGEQVDLVWLDEQGRTRYAAWHATQPATQPAEPEIVAGLTHAIYGIGRRGEQVSVGLNNSKRLTEWTRGADGRWTEAEAGGDAGAYYGQIGGYAVNPRSGLGGFIVTSAAGETVVLLENDRGEWKRQVLAKGQEPVTRAAFTFTPRGTPVVAYQALGDKPTVRAGAPASAGNATLDAHKWFPLDIAADGEGVLHLVVALHTGAINYYRSRDGGATWTPEAMVAPRSTYGDGAFLQAAVSPDGRVLAALIPAGVHGLQLAVSRDGGKEWETQDLPGYKGQRGGIAIGAKHALYLGLQKEEDKSVHLLIAPLK